MYSKPSLAEKQNVHSKRLAVVEYVGPFPKSPAPHGNAKRQTRSMSEVVKQSNAN